MKLFIVVLVAVAALGISGLLYSLVSGASARESGSAVGSFVGQGWPYLLGSAVALVVLWGVLERVMGRNRRD